MNSTIAPATKHSPIPTVQHSKYATRLTSGQLPTESRLPVVRIAPTEA